jgi:putative hemolysin
VSPLFRGPMDPSFFVSNSFHPSLTTSSFSSPLAFVLLAPGFFQYFFIRTLAVLLSLFSVFARFALRLASAARVSRPRMDAGMVPLSSAFCARRGSAAVALRQQSLQVFCICSLGLQK